MNILCEHPAPGLSTIDFVSTGRRLQFRCDAIGHRIVVTEGDGRIVHVFGGPGTTPGCFDTPLDVVCVRPEFAGERLPLGSVDGVWLAVADYGNRRVQVFEIDGALVGEFTVDGVDGDNWTPTGLAWRSPVLELEGVEGARTAVYLSAALLAGGTPTVGPFVPGSEVWH